MFSVLSLSVHRGVPCDLTTQGFPIGPQPRPSDRTSLYRIPHRVPSPSPGHVTLLYTETPPPKTRDLTVQGPLDTFKLVQLRHHCTETPPPPNLFKLVHYETRTADKWAACILLECFLVFTVLLGGHLFLTLRMHLLAVNETVYCSSDILFCRMES